jgi:microcystin degradation protein MlrC
MTRRVLSAELAHETNTFSILPTTLESYHSRLYYEGDDIARAMGGAACEMAAHIDAAKRHNWSLVQPLATRATPSGKTTAEAWAILSGKVLAACDEGPFDGVILALHGAMVTEDQDDAEGDLLARLRQRVGPDIPIAITLDLHANVSDAMAEHANIVMAYRTYPHIDQYEIATEAADLMERAMAGEINPRSVVARGPLIEGCNHGQTQVGPMVGMLKRAAGYVADDPGVLSVAVCAGFSLADIPFMGPTVTVVGDGDNEKYGQIADAMMDEVWDTRKDITVPTFSLAEAMAAAKASAGQGGKPLVLADFSDNPGSGGYGDSVRLLEAMIDAGIDNAALGVISDPDVVAACQAAGAGNQVTLSLGSKVDATLYGPPLELTATVQSLSDGSYVCDGPMLTGEARSMGPTAVLRIGGVRAIIASNNQQVTDRQVFISQGIEPTACDVVAVKSAHHFRAAFEPMSRDVMLADSGSLATRDLNAFPWHRLRRPVYPLDDV